MRSILISLFSLLFVTSLFAQKPILSDTSYKNWSYAFDGSISADGKYADYQIRNYNFSERTTILTSTDKSWERRFNRTEAVQYSYDGKYAYLVVDNKLLKIQLSTDRIDTLRSCQSFKLVMVGEKEYLICRLLDNDEISVQSTDNHYLHILRNVREYWLQEKCETILICQSDSLNKFRLFIFDPLKDSRKVIFKSGKVSDVIISKSGNALAFMAEVKGSKSIWYFHKKMKEARHLFSDDKFNGKLRISTGFWQFSKCETRLLFTLERQFALFKVDKDAPDVWSHEDKITYAKLKNQNFNLNGRIYGENLSSIDVNSGECTSLLKSGEKPVWGFKMIGDFIVIESPVLKKSLPLKKSQPAKTYFLLNVVTKKKFSVKNISFKGLLNFKISPDERNLIFFDLDSNHWMCYQIKHQICKQFAKEINSKLFYYRESTRSISDIPLATFGWIPGTDHLIMQGTYDLWEVSVTNKIIPLKLTTSLNKEIYTLAIRPKSELIDPNGFMYIYSQNLLTRSNSFYRFNMRTRELKELYSGNYYWATLYTEVGDAQLKKAKDAEAFLFKEGHVEQYENYLFATDFQNIVNISENHPEKEFNWINSELLHYKDSDSNDCQAILYKPDNFDPNKKYPVIFSIYQDQSYSLNKHISADWPGIGINVPYMVSNGFLVCKPDVYISKGKIGEYALKSVEAACDFLSKQTWIDSTKMGLTGHSLGGFETNYIITHSNRFAAAISTSSISSMINSYNDLWGDGEEKQSFTKFSAPWMGESLENDLGAYIENSPILHAKQMETPLLLIHGDADPNAPWYHSLQFFLQLRSMRKKVWLVSYANEGHGIANETNRKDFSGKFLGFFDYYLRNKPKPEWMKKHIDF